MLTSFFRWNNATQYAWTDTATNQQLYGYEQYYGNLRFVGVLNAGHMVPVRKRAVGSNTF